MLRTVARRRLLRITTITPSMVLVVVATMMILVERLLRVFMSVGLWESRFQDWGLDGFRDLYVVVGVCC